MKLQTISITQLLVNPENPRFEAVKSENDAIDLMMAKAGEEVFNLARDITQNGVNPSKSLIVVAAGDKYMPVEGNRRVVALKLLQLPSMTTNAQFQAKFAKLRRTTGAILPKRVSCVVFPTKEAAAKWVSLEHTGANNGVGVLRWDSKQRQRFQAQLNGTPPSRAIQLLDFATENRIGHDRVDATTLDRLLTHSETRNLLGLEFTDGSVAMMKPKGTVLSDLRKLFTRMSADDFTVADVYTKPKAISWVASTLEVSQPKTGKTRESGKPSRRPAQTGPLDGDWVTSKLAKEYPLRNRVKTVLRELQALHPTTRPNVCATSLRVLLELAVYVYLQRHGIIKKLIEDEKATFAARNKKRDIPLVLDKHWAPDFHRMLDHLSSDEALMPNPADRKALSTFVTKHGSNPFLIELNLFTHNPSYAPTAQNVLEIWDKMGKLIFGAILGNPT